jgi:hypothetical protein
MYISMKNLSLFLFVVVAVASRFLPHFPNMTAVGALALFAGASVKPRWLGVTLPIAIIAITDLALGFDATLLFGYAAWALIALLSSRTLNSFSMVKLGGMSVFSSLCFFVVSNFGVWSVGGLYSRTTLGLVECFVAALPFLGQQMLGDLFFSGLLFLAWEQLEKRFFSSSQILA